MKHAADRRDGATPIDEVGRDVAAADLPAAPCGARLIRTLTRILEARLPPKGGDQNSVMLNAVMLSSKE